MKDIFKNDWPGRVEVIKMKCQVSNSKVSYFMTHKKFKYVRSKLLYKIEYYHIELGYTEFKGRYEKYPKGAIFKEQ